MNGKTVFIGQRPVGAGHPCYLIAEIGANHNQSLDRALEMIGLASRAGCDAVKFQSILLEELYAPEYESDAFKTWFRQIELAESWYPRLAAEAAAQGVHFLSSPTYERAVGLLEAVGAPAFKLASPQVRAHPMVMRRALATGKPLILSFGYCDYAGIGLAMRLVREQGAPPLVVLHCISKYPAAPAEVNLRFMPTLGAMTGSPFGFSDHSLGTHLAVAAVAMGACVVEKHVTQDRDLPGPDHKFALTFPEFAAMARQIRETEAAMGDGTRIDLLPEEESLVRRVRLKAFAERDIPAGQRLQAGDLRFARANREGVPYEELPFLLGCRARAAIPGGALLEWPLLDLDH